MGAGPFILELIFVLILTIYLLHKYGNWHKQHLIVTVSTFIAWYFSFVIIFVIPLDVSLTFYKLCLNENGKDLRNMTLSMSSPNTVDTLKEETLRSMNTMSRDNISKMEAFCEKPNGWIPDHVLLSLWRIVYWTAQLLTWIVLPLMQSYSQAAEFNALGKLRRAIYMNAIYYGSYMLIFGFLLVYVAMKGIAINADHLKVILVSASNTWGLFLLVLLLGYGLVEVPRQLWLKGNKGYRLNKIYFDIEKVWTDKNDAEEAVRETYRDAQEAYEKLRNCHSFRKYAETILNKFPSETVHNLSRSLSSTVDTLTVSDAANLTLANEQYLVRLHRRAMECLQAEHRTGAQWQALINQALYLEQVASTEQRRVAKFIPSYPLQTSTFRQTFCTPTIEYYWECVIKRPLYQVGGVILTLMTVLIVWSECTFFLVKPTLSIFAALIHWTADGYHYKYIQLCSVLVISYLCMCAYYTVFKLRIYRYYHLDPHHQTDENSLLFSGILLCRLTPPICLNFLGMIHLDSHIASDVRFGVETQFTKLMGHLDVIPVIAKGINIYLPILITLFCLCTWFRVGTRLLHSLGIEQFVADDEMTAEMVDSGKALVALERNRLNRKLIREGRDERIGQTAGRSATRDECANLGEYSDREAIVHLEYEQEDTASKYGTSPPRHLFDDI